MDGVRRLGRELSCGPMRIAVPHAPRDRRVGFRQLLEHRDAVHWRQVEPAIGRRQENAKKAGVGEVAREIFRQPSGCFDTIALRDNTRLEVAGSCKKGSAIDRIVHSYPPMLSVKPLSFDEVKYALCVSDILLLAFINQLSLPPPRAMSGSR